MKLYISNVYAVTNGLSHRDDFCLWDGDIASLSGDVSIDIKSIPPMLRRRCSFASKIALATSLPLLDKTDIKAGVFCSQHGELANTVDIFQNLADAEILSPNKFSQCVHNTASGILSVHKKLTIPFNSIAAGQETFQMALVDASIQLSQYPVVLFTAFDDILPSVYDGHNVLDNLAYGVSLIISKEPIDNTSIALEISISSSENHSKSINIPTALNFAHWFYRATTNVLNLPMLKIQRL